MLVREILEAGASPSGKRPKERVKETLKRAIWEAHSRRCVYCGEPVGIKEMEPDHIIYQEIDYEVLLALYKRIALPPSFNLNGAENLLCAHSYCNKSKNDYVPSDEILSGLLMIAERKKKRVLDLQQKYIEQNGRDHNIAKALCYLESEIETKGSSPEQIYDRLSGGGDPFPIDEAEYDNQIKLSEPNISLWCALPKFPDFHGSVAISFRNLKIRDCIISLKHEDIVNILFQAVNSPPSLSLRNFIKPLNNGEYLASFGSVTFVMKSDEADQLCSIVDRLVIHYINASRNIEFILKSNRFLPAKSGGFYLFKTSRKAWSEIINFSRKHDGFDGNSEWDIFDSHGSFLKVYSTSDNSGDKDYRMFAFPDQVENENWPFFVRPDDEVWVRWEPNLLMLGEDGALMLTRGEIWDAEFCLEWCINKLIPKVRESCQSSNIWRNLFKLPYDGSHFWHEPGFWYGEPLNTFNSIGSLLDLRKTVERMQYFYIGDGEAYMSREGIRGIYLSSLFCLQEFSISSGTIKYVREKTGGEASIDGICQWLQSQLASSKLDFGVSGSLAEMALRPIIVMMQDGSPKITEIEILKALLPLLNPAWEAYRMEIDIDRLRSL